jgi:glycerol uptake facilitator protein
MEQKGMFGEVVGEIFGTFILILLGDGVVAQVGLAARLAAPAYDWNTITWGWAMAVLVAVYVVGGVSGAHINPAVTIALAVKRGFPWAKVVPYVVAQMVGAFLGALGVYLVYMEGLISAGLPNVWCTGPGNNWSGTFWGQPLGFGDMGSAVPYSLMNACLAEFFGTAVLLWGVLASGDAKNLGLKDNLGVFIVVFTVLSVGLSLGGPSGYAINPARDLGPRLFGLVIGTQGLFDGIYWLVPPVIVTVIGGTVGAITYDMFVTPFLGGE